MKYSKIYNRIADTYFTGVKEHLRNKAEKNNKIYFFAAIVLLGLAILTSIYFTLTGLSKDNARVTAQKKSLSVLGNILPLKIDYNFLGTSENVKNISLDLPKIDLSGYDALEVNLRGDPAKGFSRLIRIDFESSRKEKKGIYIEGIDSAWKTFKIPLGHVSSLMSFSDLQTITFVVEGWNINKPKGCIFIDKIRFVKDAKKP